MKKLIVLIALIPSVALADFKTDLLHCNPQVGYFTEGDAILMCKEDEVALSSVGEVEPEGSPMPHTILIEGRPAGYGAEKGFKSATLSTLCCPISLLNK